MYGVKFMKLDDLREDCAKKQKKDYILFWHL